MVKRRKLQWYGHVSRSSDVAKTILQGTVKGGRRQGRQRKRREDNIREWTGLGFGKSQRAVENREKMEKTGCKIICGAPTTLAVKGLKMMMMNHAERRDLTLAVVSLLATSRTEYSCRVQFTTAQFKMVSNLCPGKPICASVRFPEVSRMFAFETAPWVVCLIMALSVSSILTLCG